ncbi:MAG: FtsW/RodA/SpoVE family cell cycle protein [Treponema sp.]|nr:FtsW/RodA/SpoVE family cell cycle protein [Treponema sp.]
MRPLREDRQIFRYDYILFATVILLTLIGLVTLYSASYLFALNQPWRFGSRGGWTPIFGNIIACLIMVFLFPFLAFVKLDLLKKEWIIIGLVLFTIFINLLPFIPFFQKSNFDPAVDVRRWIILRRGGSDWLSFQPSEVIKVVLPLYLAYILDKNTEKINNFFYGPVPPALVTAVFCALVVLQNNLSEVVLITLISLAVCLVAGIRLRWFAVAFALSLPFGHRLIFGDAGGRWYQRIYTFFNPGQDMFGARYQIDMSMEAIRSGGFLGRGIGQGTLKTRVPEVHGDFVFASFAEEFGLVGVFLHLVLIGVFAGIVFYVVWRSRDRFSQLLAFGLVTPIIMQTLLNVAVVANVVPTTGIALPFVSSGGSSLLMTLCASALLVNLARRHVLSLEKEAWNAG